MDIDNEKDDVGVEYIVLSYASCHFTTLLVGSIILVTMFFFLIIMKLFVDADSHRHNNSCLPTTFYFGEKDGCRRLIDNTVNETITNDALLLLHQLHL